MRVVEEALKAFVVVMHLYQRAQRRRVGQSGRGSDADLMTIFQIADRSRVFNGQSGGYSR